MTEPTPLRRLSSEDLRSSPFVPIETVMKNARPIWEVLGMTEDEYETKMEAYIFQQGCVPLSLKNKTSSVPKLDISPLIQPKVEELCEGEPSWKDKSPIG